MLTLEIMDRMWPQGDNKIPGLRAGIVAGAVTVFPKYQLNSDLTIAHAMAQFSHECGAGLEVEENLNYSAARMMQVWPSRFPTLASAAPYAGNPRNLANNVYGSRMGNRPGTDDGWNFRGRGAAQTTGRAGYQAVGDKMGLSLVDNPDAVNDPRSFLECAVADFIICGCLPFAENDDVSGVTKHLNGGFIGLSDRTKWLEKWKAALNGGTAPAAHSTAWIQDALNRLGADPVLLVDGSYGPITEAAVRAFQQARGLTVDGLIGPQTLGVLDAALAALAPQ